MAGRERTHRDALKASTVVAIHHHMTDESPRMLFLHYWGRGPAAGLVRTGLVRTVKAAVDQTSWEGAKR